MSFSLNFSPHVSAVVLYSPTFDYPDGKLSNTEFFDHDFLIAIVLHGFAARSKINKLKDAITKKHWTIVNTCDSTGKTLLFWSLFSKEPIDKIMECAQFLIESGADMDVRLNKNGTGSNLLGFCIEILDQKKLPDFVEKGEQFYGEGWVEKKLADVKAMAVYLLGRGSVCRVGNGELSEKHLEILNELKADALAPGALQNWSDLRLVYLGGKSAGSEFAECPPELLHLISEAIIEQSFKN